MTAAPVILFAYARPAHLERTLKSLRENNAKLIYAFSDAPRNPENAADVEVVRRMLRDIDWCEVVIAERETNFGLGRSIVAGLTQVLAKHESAIVFEDDLICVPGTLDFLNAALERYALDDGVMSVTAWTHPLITPAHVKAEPYFDGRAECWVWGTWARAWRGMDTTALSLMEECRARGIDEYRYGADLVDMAKQEAAKNIWAVRFLYLHILRKGLCLRPPWSMVEHTGFDESATNSADEMWLRNPALRDCPPIPAAWPAVRESEECAALHRKMWGGRPVQVSPLRRALNKVASGVRKSMRAGM